MKYSTFTNHCGIGSQVCYCSNPSFTGRVYRISKDGCRALVHWSNHVCRWENYYLIDLINCRKEEHRD